MNDRAEVPVEASENPPARSEAVSAVSPERISSALEVTPDMLEVTPDILKIAEQEAEDRTLKALRRDRWLRDALLLVVFAILIYLGWFMVHENAAANDIYHDHGLYIGLAGLLGASVGTSELVSRYRDEPTQALRNWSAFTYLTLNAIISISAYGLLTRYGKTLIPAIADDPLMRSIAAGFGAMAILRSKFFTLRTEKGEDIGVGPDAAISAFLSAADRGVDRKRAERRLKLVFDSASKVTSYENVRQFITVSLLSFQNLNDNEKRSINDKINEIYGDKGRRNYPTDELRLQALCYQVLIIIGDYNFNRLISNLRRFIEFNERQVKAREDLATKTKEAFVVKLREQVEPTKPRRRAGISSLRSGGQTTPQTTP
jgi:hypothetical protein